MLCVAIDLCITDSSYIRFARLTLVVVERLEKVQLAGSGSTFHSKPTRCHLYGGSPRRLFSFQAKTLSEF